MLRVTLGDNIYVEDNVLLNAIDYMHSLEVGVQKVPMTRFNVARGGINIYPGQYVIGESLEHFQIVNHADYTLVLDETLRMSGLSVSVASGDINGKPAPMKLIIKNNLQHHALRLTERMNVGQLKFHY